MEVSGRRNLQVHQAPPPPTSQPPAACWPAPLRTLACNLALAVFAGRGEGCRSRGLYVCRLRLVGGSARGGVNEIKQFSASHRRAVDIRVAFTFLAHSDCIPQPLRPPERGDPPLPPLPPRSPAPAATPSVSAASSPFSLARPVSGPCLLFVQEFGYGNCLGSSFNCFEDTACR